MPQRRVKGSGMDPLLLLAVPIPGPHLDQPRPMLHCATLHRARIPHRRVGTPALPAEVLGALVPVWPRCRVVSALVQLPLNWADPQPRVYGRSRLGPSGYCGNLGSAEGASGERGDAQLHRRRVGGQALPWYPHSQSPKPALAQGWARDADALGAGWFPSQT